MSELPAQWIECQIGEVTQIVSGGTPPSKDVTNFTTNGGIPWVTPADLSGYKKIYISRGMRNLTEKGLKLCSASIIPAGSVLFSSRAPVGYVAIAANDITTNQGFKSFILPSELESKYIYYYLRYIKPIAEEMATGTTFKELSGSKSAQLPLLVAPLNEQKRIADKLDMLLAHVEACREHLEHVLGILKRFRQAVLSAATAGRLTEEWVGGHNQWQTCTLGSVLTDLRYGTSKKSVYGIKNGKPVLRIPNIGDRKIDPSDLKFSQFNDKEIESLSLRAGDLLIIRSNGSVELVGKVAVVSPEFEGYMYAGYLMRLRLDKTRANPSYVSLYLLSPAIRNHIEFTSRSTSGVNNINSEEVKAIPLELPSLAEQQEIVRQIEILFTYADRMEARYQAACNWVDGLTSSLLAKAFRGELVMQDPDDEPASALLEHIWAKREADAKDVKQRPKPVSKEKRSKTEGIMKNLTNINPTHLSDILKESGAMSAESLWAASELKIEDFYDQLKDEELKGLLREIRDSSNDMMSVLEAL